MSKKFLITIAFISFFSLIVNGAKRALIVGIGNYDTDKTGWEKIHGDKDVDLLAASLKHKGFSNQNIKTLKNEEATKLSIIKALKNLAAHTQEGDCVIFHFSGHGQPVVDLNGDESNGKDEAIVPFDAYKTPRYKVGSSHYQGENHIIDDELNPIFSQIKKKIGKTGYFLVTIDACYSRGIEMDVLGFLTPDDLLIAGNPRGTDHVFRVTKKSPLYKIPLPKVYSKSGKMTVISACREDERNFEYSKPNSNEVYGSLSYTLSFLINKGYTFSDIEKYFKNKDYLKDKIFTNCQNPKIIFL